MKRKKIHNRIFQRVYFDPAHPGGFSGISQLSKLIKGKKSRSFKRNIAKKWLLEQPSYYLHIVQKKVKNKQTIKVSGIHTQWEADLIFFPGKKKFIPVLSVIDVFSKRADIRILSDKKPESVVNGFKNILTKSPYLGYESVPALRHPHSLRTDSGTEFKGKEFKKFIIEYNISHYFAKNDETKACFVERFNRTLKTRVQKYMTHKNISRFSKQELEILLHKMLKSYNYRFHSTIKMKPMSVSLETQHKIQFKKDPVISNERIIPINSLVRISRKKRVFSKGYNKNFTSEKFKVIRRSSNSPYLYQLEDLFGETIQGKFYEKELLPVEIS